MHVSNVINRDEEELQRTWRGDEAGWPGSVLHLQVMGGEVPVSTSFAHSPLRTECRHFERTRAVTDHEARTQMQRGSQKGKKREQRVNQDSRRTANVGAASDSQAGLHTELDGSIL